MDILSFKVLFTNIQVSRDLRLLRIVNRFDILYIYILSIKTCLVPRQVVFQYPIQPSLKAVLPRPLRLKNYVIAVCGLHTQ